MKAGIPETSAVVHVGDNAQASIAAGRWGKRAEYGCEKYLSRRFVQDSDRIQE